MTRNPDTIRDKLASVANRLAVYARAATAGSAANISWTHQGIADSKDRLCFAPVSDRDFPKLAGRPLLVSTITVDQAHNDLAIAQEALALLKSDAQIVREFISADRAPTPIEKDALRRVIGGAA